MNPPYAANLPYAAPLRAVDELRVTEQDGLLLLSVGKDVVPGDPYLAAHFPGRTIYPGVFVVETVRQAVAAALGERSGVLPDLSAVSSLRLVGALHPGDRLCVQATVGGARADGAIAVTARCRRADGSDVARLALEFRYEEDGDGCEGDGRASIAAERGAE